MSDGPWLPDGRGLPVEARELNALHQAPVHLRLTNPDRSIARGACDGGLGQLWTGDTSEVTCPVCLELIHA